MCALSCLARQTACSTFLWRWFDAEADCSRDTALLYFLQIRHPTSLPWDKEALLRYNGRSAVVLSSMQGLELKGCFVRTRMAVPTAAAGHADDAASDHLEEQEVVLFMGAPWMHSLSEVQVGGCAARGTDGRLLLGRAEVGELKAGRG